MADTEPEKGDDGRQRYKLPSSNPLPLSAAQEGLVRDRYYKNVRKICDDQIRAFAECASGRTFSMIWKCRGQKKAMTECMVRHATPEAQDRAREEWFHERMELAKEKKGKQKERELKEQQQQLQLQQLQQQHKQS